MRASIALATAVGVHAVVWIAAATAPMEQRAPRTYAIEVSVLSFERLEPVTGPALLEPEDPTLPIEAPPTSHRARDRVRGAVDTLHPVVDTSSVGETSGHETVSDTRSIAPPDAPSISAGVDVSIDPSSVARAMVLSGATGPVDVPQTGRRVGPRIRGERDTERAFDDDLRRAAMAKAYVTRRGPIHLTPHPDGTFTYDGPQFDATIHPDGRVTYRDRDDASIDTPQLGQAPPLTDVTGAPLDSAPLFRDVPVAQLSVSGTFDVDSPLTRARGEDPHRFERERFLEETRELRERLEDEDRERDLARARRRRPRDAGTE